MKKSLLKNLKSFGFAWKGIAFVMRNENNMRYHIFFTGLVILMGLAVKLSKGEWIAIVLCMGMVWTAELFNSAIEKLVDLVSPGFNDKAGTVKDIAAGAVLIASITALVTGIVVFTAHI